MPSVKEPADHSSDFHTEVKTMRSTTKHALSGLLALALTVLLVPATADAQEQTEEAPEQETCTAELNPNTVPPGEAAVRVQVTLSSAIGGIESVVSGEEAGVSLADPADIREKVGMAQEEDEQPPQPVQMASEGQSAHVWVSTAEASTGTHQVALESQEGQCIGEITVEEPGDDEEGGR
jgi:hypothetical protein